MKVDTKKLSGGVSLGIINTDKFKNNYFSVNFVLPLTKENIAVCSVLASVLQRGTSKYPTSALINRKLCMLYDPTIDVSVIKLPRALVFRATASFLDSSYLPSDGEDVLVGLTDMIKDILTDPVRESGTLSASYTESEKKRQIDRIRALINNKDALAYARCEEIAYGDIPMSYSSRGTEEDVSKITPAVLSDKLEYILKKSPVEAIFAGNYTKKAEEAFENMLSDLFGNRNESALLTLPEMQKPSHYNGVKEISEETDAKQGRMVLAYKMRGCLDNTAPTEVFTELFGASPVSRLFMNVRERLSLCYYCMSIQQYSAEMMFIRSGIEEKNKEKAIAEIERQLEALKNPSNISDEELETAKKGILNTYRSTKDDAAHFAEWYVLRKINLRITDIDENINSVLKVTKDDVAKVAREAEMKVNYFLCGKNK